MGLASYEVRSRRQGKTIVLRCSTNARKASLLARLSRVALRAVRPRPGLLARNPALWFLLPAAIVLIGVYLAPMLYSMRVSFTRWVLVEPGSEDDPAGIANYVEVLQSHDFWAAVRVTVTYAGSSIACGLVLGTCFALLLNLEFFWRTFFRSVMMIPMVITPAVIGIFWKLLYDQQTGVFNHLLNAVG